MCRSRYVDSKPTRLPWSYYVCLYAQRVCLYSHEIRAARCESNLSEPCFGDRVRLAAGPSSSKSVAGNAALVGRLLLLLPLPMQLLRTSRALYCGRPDGDGASFPLSPPFFLRSISQTGCGRRRRRRRREENNNPDRASGWDGIRGGRFFALFGLAAAGLEIHIAMRRSKLDRSLEF